MIKRVFFCRQASIFKILSPVSECGNIYHLISRRYGKPGKNIFHVLSVKVLFTNKNTVLPSARIYFLRHSKIVQLFVLSSHMISLTNAMRIQYFSDVESVYLLSNSSIGILVISVRIRIFKWPNSSCLNN